MSVVAIGVTVVLAVVLLVVVCLLVFVWPGWARGARSVEMTPPAAPPTYPRALREPAEGTYRGTIRAPDGPLVRAHGLGGGGRVKMVLATEGLVLERRGTNDLLIEEQELGGAEARDGVLVVRWWHDGVPLETVVELDTPGDVAGWVKSLEQMGHRR